MVGKVVSVVTLGDEILYEVTAVLFVVETCVVVGSGVDDGLVTSEVNSVEVELVVGVSEAIVVVFSALVGIGVVVVTVVVVVFVVEVVVLVCVVVVFIVVDKVVELVLLAVVVLVVVQPVVLNGCSVGSLEPPEFCALTSAL